MYGRKEEPLKLEGKDRYGKLQKINKTFLNDTVHITSEGTHEAKLLDTPEYQAIIERVYELLKQGFRSNEILADLMIEDHSLTETKFSRILKHAYQYAENALHKDREYLFKLHMDRYEKIYQQCVVLHDSWHRPLDPIKDWHIIVMKYRSAMKALKSKEDLLGLHDKSVVIEFNDHTATVIEQETNRGSEHVAGYDLSQLTIDELSELLALVKETRTLPLEGVQRVVVKRTQLTVDITTGDRSSEQVTDIIHEINKKIVFEDMPAEVVSKFQDITKNPDDDFIDLGEANVIDNVPREYRKKPKISKEDIQKKMQDQALDELKKKLKGG